MRRLDDRCRQDLPHSQVRVGSVRRQCETDRHVRAHREAQHGGARSVGEDGAGAGVDAVVHALQRDRVLPPVDKVRRRHVAPHLPVLDAPLEELVVDLVNGVVEQAVRIADQADRPVGQLRHEVDGRAVRFGSSALSLAQRHVWGSGARADQCTREQKQAERRHDAHGATQRLGGRSAPAALHAAALEALRKAGRRADRDALLAAVGDRQIEKAATGRTQDSRPAAPDDADSASSGAAAGSSCTPRTQHGLDILADQQANDLHVPQRSQQADHVQTNPGAPRAHAARPSHRYRLWPTSPDDDAQQGRDHVPCGGGDSSRWQLYRRVRLRQRGAEVSCPASAESHRLLLLGLSAEVPLGRERGRPKTPCRCGQLRCSDGPDLLPKFF